MSRVWTGGAAAPRQRRVCGRGLRVVAGGRRVVAGGCRVGGGRVPGGPRRRGARVRCRPAVSVSCRPRHSQTCRCTLASVHNL